MPTSSSPRIHLDHQHLGGFGFTQNCTFARRCPRPLLAKWRTRRLACAIFAVGQRLDWGHRDGITVCTPMASMFSMPQTMMQLSRPSRTTSSSYSFQPSTDWSICAWPIMEAIKPRVTMSSNSALFHNPPKATQGERRTNDQRQANFIKKDWASDMDSTVRALGNFRPSFSTTFRKACRSSARG